MRRLEVINPTGLEREGDVSAPLEGRMRFDNWIGLLVCFSLAIGCTPNQRKDGVYQAARPVTKSEFEKKYRAWQEKVNNDLSHLSSFERYRECREYKELAQLGVSAVPFFIEAIEDSNRFWKEYEKNKQAKGFGCGYLLSEAVERATKIKLKKEESAIDWWYSRDQVPARFKEYYAKWKAAKQKGAHVLETEVQVFDPAAGKIKTKVTKTELGRAYESLRGLGIDALPLIVEQLKEKDYDLLPLFHELTGEKGPPRIGTVEEQARLALGWWGTNKRDWTLPPPQAKGKKE